MRRYGSVVADKQASPSFSGVLCRSITQQDAAKLCGTDQPTLSKVLRGRMESVTIDRLAVWLMVLGRIVEIHVRPYNARSKAGHLAAIL